MAVKSTTILQGLQQERDRLLEALKPIDTKTLQAQLATIEHAIAIYEPRVTENAKVRLPKTLKAASKIRSDNNGNGPVRGANGHVINPDSEYQKKFARMRAMLSDPNNGDRRAMAPYINNGLLVKDKKGVYSITPKGKARLSELTHDTSA